VRTPKGANPIEFRAAALYASYLECHDYDDVIDDRITSRCIAQMLGMRDVGREARPVYDLYLEMISP
jgi:hypothetical protein